jgi:hypothetical protein
MGAGVYVFWIVWLLEGVGGKVCARTTSRLTCLRGMRGWGGIGLV